MVEPRKRNGQVKFALKEDEEAALLPPSRSDDVEQEPWERRRRRPKHDHNPDDNIVPILVTLGGVLMFLLFLIYWLFFRVDTGGHALPVASPCDTVEKGYQCATYLSQRWGQYSPYYRVPSDISSRPPSGCQVTFAQLLSRHGARYPTAEKTILYNDTIAKIKSSPSLASGPFDFLQHYEYDLGADDLTSLGRQELVNSGIDFFTRYEHLAVSAIPFIRASQQERVVESAVRWMEGFHKARAATGLGNDSSYPYPVLEVSEAKGMNNTLSHGLCDAFENNRTGAAAQATYSQFFLPKLTASFQKDLGAQPILDDTNTLHLMDLCPFTAVAESIFPPAITPSQPQDNSFCTLIPQSYWSYYTKYESIGKYFGFGPGAPLGPTQGVGFVNELIARLTSQPVADSTSTNRTLDADVDTFPLDRKLYADFSHDNDMTAIFAAMRLFEDMAPPRLDDDDGNDEDDETSYAASRTVPFAGRAIVEKLSCEVSGTSKEKEFVRVIMNGRVLPLGFCGGDRQGRCVLKDFVDSMEFSRAGGRWSECFEGSGTAATA